MGGTVQGTPWAVASHRDARYQLAILRPYLAFLVYRVTNNTQEHLMHSLRPLALFAIAASVIILPHSPLLGSTPMTSDITYQGRLSDAAGPANGNYDMIFNLFDAS